MGCKESNQTNKQILLPPPCWREGGGGGGKGKEATYSNILCCYITTCIWQTEGVIIWSVTDQTWSLPGKFAHLYDFSIRSFDCMVCRLFHTLSRNDFRSNVIRPISYQMYTLLTLKALRKNASENVVCCK